MISSDLKSIEIRAIWRAVKEQGLPFYFINLYLFFEYVRPQSIYPAINVLPFAQTTILLAGIFAILSKPPKVGGNPVNKSLAIFAVVVIISSAFAYSPSTSIDKALDFFSWVLIFYIFTLIIRTPTQFYITLLAYLLYNFKMSQHGFFVWVSRGFEFVNWGIGGAPGWFHNSGEFGIQLTIFLPLVVCFALASWPHCGTLKRAILIFVPLTAIGSVIATSSRGALLGAVAAMLFLGTKSRHWLRVGLALIVVGAITYSFIPEESLERFRASGSDNTSVHRLNLWSDAIRVMNDYPIFGVGYGNWTKFYVETQPVRDRGTVLVHNSFLQAGVELGYLGLAALIAIIISSFVLNGRTRRLCASAEDRYFRFISYGLDAGMIGFIVSGSFVTVLYYPYLWIQISFVVALHNAANSKVGALRNAANSKVGTLRNAANNKVGALRNAANSKPNSV